MPRKVRGIQIHNVNDLTVGQLLEQLRHAGVMGKISGHESPIEIVYVPAHIRKSCAGDWVQQNAERMATFGISAEIAYTTY